MEDLKAKLQKITTDAKEVLKLEREAAKKLHKEKVEEENKIAKASAKTICEIAVDNALVTAAAGKSRIEIGTVELTSYSTGSILVYSGDNAPATTDKEAWRKREVCSINELLEGQFKFKVDFYTVQMLVNDYSMPVLIEYQHDGVGVKSWHMLVLEW